MLTSGLVQKKVEPAKIQILIQMSNYMTTNTINKPTLRNILPEIYIDDCIRELKLINQISPEKLHSRFSGMYDFYRELAALTNDSAVPLYSKKDFFNMMDRAVKKQLLKQGLEL